MSLLCLDDFEKKAHEKLEVAALGYYKSGAGDELTLSKNRTSFDKYMIIHVYWRAKNKIRTLLFVD